MVRKYFSALTPALTGEGGARYRVITMEGGFHGRTLACISAGGNDIARKGYEPLIDGFDRVEFNNLKAVEAAIGRRNSGYSCGADSGRRRHSRRHAGIFARVARAVR